MDVLKMNENRIINIICGLIIGVIFGLIFRYFRNNINAHGPNSNKVKKEIFRENDKCYKFIPRAIVCPISKNKRNKKSDRQINTYIMTLK